jgi:hypothetical protein
MHLHPEEPEAGSCQPADDVELAFRVRALLPPEIHALVLVDGRPGSGKSTFAERLARLLDGAVVHSDDIAWRHDPVHWADVLVEGVIAPWRRGEVIYFRPPGWVVQGSPGAVEVRRHPFSSSRASALDGPALRHRSEEVTGPLDHPYGDSLRAVVLGEDFGTPD